MEELQEKEKTLFHLINESQNNGDYDKEKINNLLTQVLTENTNQADQLTKEIEMIENTNKLCNLSLQISLLQYM